MKTSMNPIKVMESGIILMMKM